jgi:NAD(P)-dependent dehydrogenase (short-subunit alcohol dehydrogenase family)
VDYEKGEGMVELDGRTAIVTGAGQGVGQGIALALAKAGATVVVSGRTEGKLADTCASIAAAGGKALAVPADVKRAADLAALVERAVAETGRLDVLVNNAQEVPLGRLADVTDEAFLAGFESGPLASFRLMKLAYPHMKAKGGGVIFNLASSAAVRWDMTGYGAYAAVKQAVRSLSRAAAAEWGRDGIRVLTLAPHAASPGLKGWIESNPKEAEAFFRTIPLGRVGDCEGDIGAAVVALCSPALGYLTGATIPLDGGQANFD